MNNQRFLECLAADASRLRSVAARDLEAPVPSCPGWSTADLVQHTGMVYMHKVEGMRKKLTGEAPWPPEGIRDEEPLALFDRAYVELTAEFAARDPSDEASTWYDPDPTVGFWIRRMAQETVIHRLDAELAQGEPPAGIPDDLAVDGIDEVLVVFLAYIVTKWRKEFGEMLKDCDGSAVRVEAAGRAWIVKLAADGVFVSEDDSPSVAGVSGDPAAVLKWLWGRTGDDTVAIQGDRSTVSKLRQLLVEATQ